MNRKQLHTGDPLVDLKQVVRDRNQRYLDSLKQSGDPLDARSKILATILDCVADGLIVLDPEKTILLANLAGAELAGWPLEQVSRAELRQHYRFFLDDGTTPLAHDQEPIEIAMREKRAYEVELYATSEHLPPAGRWLRVHAAPILDDNNEAIGGVTVFSDITERVVVQNQRDCLAALIAHDIKNHLAGEQMFLDLLVGLQGHQLDPEMTHLLADLSVASKNFRDIADSLLEMCRGRLFDQAEFEQVLDAAALLNSAIELSALSAIKHQVQVVVECKGAITAIRGLPNVLCHALHNVIQNAIEISPPHSTVTVCLSNSDRVVLVQVTDKGPGMGPEEVRQLFNPHRVAGHLTTTTNSTGFGLYLSAMLVEGQGGKISCQSQLGVGTTITIALPAVLAV